MAAVMIFGEHTTEGYTNPIPGIQKKTLVFGQRTLMTEFVLAKDSVLPMHDHPYEQTGYLVKGHLLLTIGDAEYDTTPGDSWCIPMNVAHGGTGSGRLCRRRGLLAGTRRLPSGQGKGCVMLSSGQP